MAKPSSPRRTAAGPVRTTSDLRQLHDQELRQLATPEADGVLAGRTRAAAQLRLVLARTYGRGDMATASHWASVVCLTDHDSIGVVDVAHGTAWDTGVEADLGVWDLGVEDGMYAAANMAPGAHGIVRFDGEPVQADGTTVLKRTDVETGEVERRAVPPSMPDRWRQIALATWRGHGGTSPYQDVPPGEYRPETWIRPILVATGLMTCYGRPGRPDAGDALSKAHGWSSAWPHGLPDWIEGQSVTVLDTIADNADSFFDHTESLRRTCIPRGSDTEEMARLRPLLERWRAQTVPLLRRAATESRGRGWVAEAEAIAAAADRVADGLAPDEDYEPAIRKVGNRTNWLIGSRAGPAVTALLQANDAIGRESPWEAARALAISIAPRILAPVWPPPAAPVGPAEIADMLGVERNTIDQWRYRAVLPEPAWTVSGRPLWERATIVRWAEETGRDLTTEVP